MKHKNNRINENTRSLIINAAYKDCNLIKSFKVKYILLKNPEYKKIYNEYRETALKIKNIPLDEYSNTEFLDSYTVPKTQNSNESLLTNLLTTIFEKPVISAAAAMAVFAVITLGIIFNKPLENPQYSREEIELANMQVKQSFAILGSVFNKTQNTIEKEVLTKRVAKPINEGITTVNNLFSGGENEK